MSRCKLLAMRNAIIAILFLVVACIAGFGQNLPAETPLRIRVSERVLDGIALKRVLPQLPCSKDTSQEKGVLTIAVLVDYDGKVKTTSPISGEPVLADCATFAIRQRQFKPYTVNGKPVQVESRVVMKFSKKRVGVVLGGQ